ncbi:MAG TPA: T9SS type A sorting domain-containing protein, partial [Cryomorphaceae bacterium]|nr:T9SS type A sorting domain-containing protein [Cryomorphaceae bacterium]
IEGGPGFIRLPDPLQQAGISKEVSMSVNMGGALADISWLEEGDAPMVTIHCIRDPFAPFDDGIVVVPTTNEDVVDVSGGNVFIQQAVDFGNNSVFTTIPDGNDPFTDRARDLYGQTYDYILGSQPEITVSPDPEGLFPILLPINTINGNRFTNQGSPWDWWDLATLEQIVAATNAALGSDYDANMIHQQSLAGNPGMGPEKGLAYIDTIQGYVNPRIMCVFGLDGNPCVLSTEETVLDNSTQIYPNPSQNVLNIRNDEYRILRVELYDITGRLVSEEVVNNNFHTFERGGLNTGVYLMQIIFDNQRITKKVMFN